MYKRAESGENLGIPVAQLVSGTQVGVTEVDQRVAKLVQKFEPRLGKAPYDSNEFELASPIGERARIGLERYMLGLSGDTGHGLFRQSSNLRQISDDAATHKALETMYVGPTPEDPEKFLWARLFMENVHNAMAVRNRKRIVKTQFNGFMRRNLEEGVDKVNILSVAAGSSRAIMEVLADINGEGHDRSRLRMVDISRDALEDGRKLVGRLRIGEQVDFIRAHFLSFRRYLGDGYKPNFVEIVGLLDYLSADEATKLVCTLRENMTPGGIMLFSNIVPNDEQDFTHKIVGWLPMIYRSAEDLQQIAAASGFDERKTSVIREPLGIYNIVVATK